MIQIVSRLNHQIAFCFFIFIYRHIYTVSKLYTLGKKKHSVHFYFPCRKKGHPVTNRPTN